MGYTKYPSSGGTIVGGTIGVPTNDWEFTANGDAPDDVRITSNDTIQLHVNGGTQAAIISSTGIYPPAVGAQLLNETPSSTNPVVTMYRSTPDTGWGGDSGDNIYGITSGATRFQISDEGVVFTPKTDTGDPTGIEGLITVNTFDNVIKIYADGAWRSLATW